MRKIFNRLSYMSNSGVKQVRLGASHIKSSGIVFAPAVLVCLLGVALIAAPKFLLAIGASFLFFIAGIMIYLGVKFIQLKRKIETIARNFDGRVIVQAVETNRPNAHTVIVEESSKKIVYH